MPFSSITREKKYALSGTTCLINYLSSGKESHFDKLNWHNSIAMPQRVNSMQFPWKQPMENHNDDACWSSAPASEARAASTSA